MRRIVLASSSPRRRELLRHAGIPFRAIDVHVCEGDDPVENALRKARAVGPQDEPVVAADTIVVLDGQVFQKPRDLEEAHTFLKRLQGRTHEVVTGVAILYRGREKTFRVTSRVTFPPMTDDEIRAYHARENPLDKAGAYGVQALPHVRVEGSRANVIGLPVERLREELEALEWS
jgi:septum formation protein